MAEAYKGFIRDRDYVSMDSAFEEIAAVQTWRNEELRQLSDLLREMAALLETPAAAPSVIGYGRPPGGLSLFPAFSPRR